MTASENTSKRQFDPFAILPIVGLVGFALQVIIGRGKRPLSDWPELALVWIHAISGVAGFFGFLGHTVRARSTAAFIGWPAGNPFQFEIGAANLALGVVNTGGIFVRGPYWLASALSQGTFLLGAAAVHIKEQREQGNQAAGNAGPVFYWDIVLPVLTFVLLALYKPLKRR